MTAVPAMRTSGTARSTWRRSAWHRSAWTTDGPAWWRWWADITDGELRTDIDRLLLRGIAVIGVLLAIVVVAGVARRALDMLAVTPAAAVSAMWLVGCAAVIGWLVLVAASASRDGRP